MKKLITIAILCISLAANLLAQTSTGPQCPPGYVCAGMSMVPDSVPLMSESALKAYALLSINRIGGGIYSPSVSGNAYFSVGYTNRDADPNRMAAVSTAQNLRPEFDPGEELQAYLSYEYHNVPSASGSSYGFTLFWASTNFYAEKVGTNWTIPAYAKTNVMEMMDWVVFPTGKAIDYAYIRLEDGNYYEFSERDNSMWREHGFLFFSRKHTGQKGKMYVNFQDGTQVIYDLETGKQRPIVKLDGRGLAGSIKGVRPLPMNTTNVVFQAGDQIIRVPFNRAAIVKVTFPSGIEDYPTEVRVIDVRAFAEDPESDWPMFNPLSGPVEFGVQPDQAILIRFEYPNHEQLKNPYEGKGAPPEN